MQEQIRVGVIGAGHWGPHLIRNFHSHHHATVRTIVEIDQDRWPSLKMRFDDIGVTDDWEAVVEDDQIDAVVIATPTSTHHDLAKAALEAGKHVMVEKPLTNSVETADELVALAEVNQRVLLVGHVFLFNAGVRHVKELLDGGSVGGVRYISMNRTNLGPVRHDVNASWDLAAHDISIASYWLDSEPTHVSATGGSWLQPGIHDAVFISARYPGDTLVHIEASWLNPQKNRMISVVGEHQMVTLDDIDLIEPVRVYDKGVDVSDSMEDTFAGFHSQIREGAVTIPRVATGEPLRTECEAFIARIRGDRETLSDGRMGAAVVRVLEAIDTSLAAGGAEVEVHPGG